MKISEDELKDKIEAMYLYSKSECMKDDDNELMEGYNSAVRQIYIDMYGFNSLVKLDKGR